MSATRQRFTRRERAEHREIRSFEREMQKLESRQERAATAKYFGECSVCSQWKRVVSADDMRCLDCAERMPEDEVESGLVKLREKFAQA